MRPLRASPSRHSCGHLSQQQEEPHTDYLDLSGRSVLDAQLPARFLDMQVTLNLSRCSQRLQICSVVLCRHLHRGNGGRLWRRLPFSMAWKATQKLSLQSVMYMVKPAPQPRSRLLLSWSVRSEGWSERQASPVATGESRSSLRHRRRCGFTFFTRHQMQAPG